MNLSLDGDALIKIGRIVTENDSMPKYIQRLPDLLTVGHLNFWPLP